MSYNEDLQSNNTELEEILALAEELPDNSSNQFEPADEDIPKVFFGKALPQTKTDTIMSFRYISKTEDISGYCKTKAQGNSSMSYPKKNQTVKLYKDAECKEKLKANFKGWGEQTKFCFKANWIDITHARNVVSARLWADVVKSRANYAELPELLRTSPNQGAVDGFPVKVYAEGIYQGRYTINIPKDAWMANMDDSLDTHCILCGENYGSGCFRAAANIDGTDWTDEIHDTVPSTIKTRWNEAISFIMNSTDDEFVAGIGDYFDVNSLIDYYLFGLASCGLDAFGKNQLYMTYDGQKWNATMYDMDSTWGLWWNGDRFVSSDYARDQYQDFKDGEGNLLYIRLESLFKDAIWERWKALRENSLSVANIINRFERFTDIAPPYLVEEDYAETTGAGAFTEIPQTNENNIQQIRQYIIDRLVYCDDALQGTTGGTAAALYPLISGSYTVPASDNIYGDLTFTVSNGNHVRIEKTNGYTAACRLNICDIALSSGADGYMADFYRTTYFTLNKGDTVRVVKKNTTIETTDTNIGNTSVHQLAIVDSVGDVLITYMYEKHAIAQDVNAEITYGNAGPIGGIMLYWSAEDPAAYILDFDIELYVNDVRYV